MKKIFFLMLIFVFQSRADEYLFSLERDYDKQLKTEIHGKKIIFINPDINQEILVNSVYFYYQDQEKSLSEPSTYKGVLLYTTINGIKIQAQSYCMTEYIKDAQGEKVVENIKARFGKYSSQK